MGEPYYDSKIGEWVAVTLSGSEVFGATRKACYERLRYANETYAAHARHSPEDLVLDDGCTCDGADAAGYPGRLPCRWCQEHGGEPDEEDNDE